MNRDCRNPAIGMFKPVVEPIKMNNNKAKRMKESDEIFS